MKPARFRTKPKRFILSSTKFVEFRMNYLWFCKETFEVGKEPCWIHILQWNFFLGYAKVKMVSP